MVVNLFLQSTIVRINDIRRQFVNNLFKSSGKYGIKTEFLFIIVSITNYIKIVNVFIKTLSLRIYWMKWCLIKEQNFLLSNAEKLSTYKKSQHINRYQKLVRKLTLFYTNVLAFNNKSNVYTCRQHQNSSLKC